MLKTQPHGSSRTMMFYTLLLPFLLLGIDMLVASVGWTYEALPNFSGKQLMGTVKLTGKIPTPRRFNLVLFSDPYYCGRISDGKGWRISPMPALGAEQELSGAVVYLEEVKKGKPRNPTSPIVQTKNCVFLPYIHATQIGQTVQFQNWDPIQHRLEIFRTTQKGAQSLLAEKLQPHPHNRKRDFLASNQIGVHRPGPEIRYSLDKPGVMVFRCRLHDYMEGWILVLPHPYFSLTGKNGEFSIKDIPPGTYSLIVWHPLGQQETMVTIGARDSQEVNILMTPTSPTIYPGEESEKNAFGIDLIGDSSIVPTVEVQK